MLFTLPYGHEAASRTAAQPAPCMLFKGKVATLQTGCTWPHNANLLVRQVSSAHQGWLLSPMLPARQIGSISIRMSSTVSWLKCRVINRYTLSRGCHRHSAKQQQDNMSFISCIMTANHSRKHLPSHATYHNIAVAKAQ